jgi:hypothetical protein
MVSIAISEAACDSLAETLPFGSVGYENAADDKGNRLISVPPDAFAKLKACAAPARATATRSTDERDSAAWATRDNWNARGGPSTAI